MLGIDLFLGDQEELNDRMINNALQGRKTCYFAINPDCYLQALDNERYRAVVSHPEHTTYVDGIGIILAQKLLRLPVAKERITTTDLFPSLLRKMNDEDIRLNVYLLGGKGDTAGRVIQKMTLQYPGVRFVGWHDGYFDADREKQIIDEINDKQVDILFVGFGCPKQELWVDEHLDQLQVKSIITCGGLFDYYSGNVARAPMFIQKIGMEWLFRLMQEPGRLYKRYLYGNARYVFHMIGMKIRGTAAEGR